MMSTPERPPSNALSLGASLFLIAAFCLMLYLTGCDIS